MCTPRQCYLLVLRLWLGATAGTLEDALRFKALAHICYDRTISIGRIFDDARIKILVDRDILGKDPRVALWHNKGLRFNTGLRTWGCNHRL